MTEIREEILEYYQLIDLGAFEKLFELFSTAIVYMRCEQKISGIEQLKSFYLEERKLEGKHEIIDIDILEDKTIVKGSFSGVNSNEEKVDFKFVDFFYFDDENKIRQRETYLGSGSHLIK